MMEAVWQVGLCMIGVAVLFITIKRMKGRLLNERRI